jgi:2-polyprenyl-6-methoxyphenol hydroxylase-like FAD-dependent oxidoreductase
MSGFRVIIVGGGLGGLTLANCLQHARIDYLLLEGREKIGLHVGAAVGIEPHGGRILDQLGVLSSLQDVIEPYRSFIFRDAQGKFELSTDFPELVEAR